MHRLALLVITGLLATGCVARAPVPDVVPAAPAPEQPTAEVEEPWTDDLVLDIPPAEPPLPVVNSRVGAVYAAIDTTAFDIPLQVNEHVLGWMEHFRGRSSGRFLTSLARKGRFEPMIRMQLRARGMPEDLIYLALIESGFSPKAYSRAHASGVWQFIEGTGKRYGLEISEYVDERRDPVKSTRAALDYLEELHKRFGSWYLAAAAYNTGENRVERILRERAGGAKGDEELFWRIAEYLPRETRDYVPMMLAATILGKFPEAFGLAAPSPEPADAFDVVSIPDATELEVIARLAEVPKGEIERLNPHFLKGMTPPGRRYDVRLPAGRGESFEARYAVLPPYDRVRTVTHVVKRGETLSHIAHRYGTTVAALQKLNAIERPRSLAAGRRITIKRGPGAAAPQAERTASAPTEEKTTAGKSADKDRTAGAELRTAANLSPEKGRAAGGKGSAAGGRAATGAATAGGATTHVVRAGETLTGIARANGMTLQELRAVNPKLARSDRILVGQVIVLRTETVIRYRVQPGDTLWAIARKHGVTAEQLKLWNNLQDAVIRPGEEVEVRLRT